MTTRSRVHLAMFVAIAVVGLVPLAAAQPATTAQTATLPLADLSEGVPTGVDAFGNGIGFVTWHDGGGSLALSAVTIEPGDPLALPDQEATEHVLQVEHRIASWGGFTQAFADDALTTWIGRDLTPYAGLRFWFKSTGSGDTIQVDLFDNRNPDLTGDSAERWFHRFRDDTDAWRLVEIPFSAFARRLDFQPSGAPNDGLGLDEASGWAIGFPPGEGTTLVGRVEAYGSSGVVAREEVTVAFADALVRVDEAAVAELRLVLSEPSDQEVSVRITVRGDDATPFRDFVPVVAMVTFAPGETEAVVDVRTLRNSRHTGDLHAIATLEGPRGATLGFLRRTLVRIVDADAFDPDLIADFGDGPGVFAGRPGTRVSISELRHDGAQARPGQDRFADVLRASWDDVGTLEARFGRAVDASHADGVAFWYYGDGSGRSVTVQLLDGSDDTRPWELVWSDEFEGPAGTPPDPSVWTPEIGDGTANGIPGWGNAERQTYTADPTNLALDGDGHLAITAVETHGDAPLCYYGAPCEYTSARIVTQGALEVTYGRIEARIRLPYGQGLWPAFWTLGANIGEVGWPESGEIDVMENIGREPSTVHGTIHGPGYSGGGGIGRGVSLPDGQRFADDFHVFAVDWWPERITWSLDGEPFSTLTPADLPRSARWVFDQPHFLILNLAVGGHWPGYPDETTTFPQTMLVDYVRVYQAPDTSARYVASFSDDVAGWRSVRLPFEAFERAAEQPAGAPDTGFGRTEVWGLDVVIDGGPGEAMLDEVRWIMGE